MPAPVIFWFRRDLRLSDSPGLAAAAAGGAPVIPVFVLDPETEALGTAHKWRLGEALRRHGAALAAAGSRLILRRGPAETVLAELQAETGAGAVHWSRLYDPAAIARDRAVRASLTERGIAAFSHAGHLLFEPGEVATGQGGFYRVYTPFWKALRGRDVPVPKAAPALAAPRDWPRGDALQSWALGAGMNRAAAVIARHTRAGEAAARARLADLVENRIARYREDRDRLDRAGTSGLGAHLALGEISPRACWHAAGAALARGADGAETFLRQLAWREFAYHLLHHTPHIAERNWRPEWDGFAWRGDNPDAERWRQGMTGEPVIDAAMRELYVTGTMHNRARMLVASYLTKHLMTDWRVGLRWFADCLTDWDPASNALGWQWVAGSGPDAAPYFRIFNPATQAEKFDPGAAYRRRFVAELAEPPGAEALAFFAAVPRSWRLSPGGAYPAPLVDLAAGRRRAREAYARHRNPKAAA